MLHTAQAAGPKDLSYAHSRQFQVMIISFGIEAGIPENPGIV
jgi:hypothetical protein